MLACAVQGSPQASPHFAGFDCQHSSKAARRDKSSRRGRGDGISSTILPNPSQGEAAGPECAQTLICTQSRARFFLLTYPLPRPQIMYDRPFATQHLIVLVGYLPKVPFAPGHSAQRPDQGEAKTLQLSYGSGILQVLISKRAPARPISAWPESSSWHPNQHIQPSDQVSYTPSAALSQMQLLQAHSPIHSRHRDRTTPSPT